MDEGAPYRRLGSAVLLQALRDTTAAPSPAERERARTWLMSEASSAKQWANLAGIDHGRIRAHMAARLPWCRVSDDY